MIPQGAPGEECRSIVVASPIEPSGASWLLNCFLELGIRVDHKPVVDRVWRASASRPWTGRMWIEQDDRSATLHPKAGVLMKFLPALTRQKSFLFRDDIRVEYVQDFPPRQASHGPRILFVRDPRDALYSSYRRLSPALPFAEFLRFPNPFTLLDRPAHWALFVAAWLVTQDICVVRFEDYKRDALATLGSVLAALHLTYPEAEIAEAVRLSSFEQARDAERAIRDLYPFDRQLANRSGTVGEGRDRPEVQAALTELESATAHVLAQLGYAAPVPAAGDAFAAARLSAAFLAFLGTAHLPEAVAFVPLDMAASEDRVFALLAFAHRLDADLLGRASLPPAEARALLDSLAELSRNHAAWLADRLSSTRSGFGDGSAYFFQRIKDMRRSDA